MSAVPEYTHIILSGGGLCGLSYLGMYRYLKQYKKLNKVRHIAGCSVGAIFAVLFALDIPVADLEKEVFELLTDSTLNSFDPSQILSILSNKGIYSMDRYRTVFQEYFKKKTHIHNITLQEFSKYTGKNIYLSVFCLNTLSNEIISNITHPHEDIVKVVCASFSIPGVFQPIQIGDFLYMDGGVGTALPIDHFNYHDTDQVLAVNLSFNPYKTTEELKDTTLFLKQLMGAVLFSQTFKLLKTYQEKTYMDLLNIEENPMDFLPIKVVQDQLKLTITKEDYDQSILYGYKTLYQYLHDKYD